MLFATLYPLDSGDFDELRGAVEKLALNDASVTVEPEASSALGNGLKCGFLGLLHMEVFHQRLTDEFNTPVLLTTPQVPYVVVDRSVPLQEGEVDLEGGGGGNVDGGFVGSVAASPADEASSSPLSSPRRYRTITSLSEWPLDEARRGSGKKQRYGVLEPMVRATIISPSEYLGALLEEILSRRGEAVEVAAAAGDTTATATATETAARGAPPPAVGEAREATATEAATEAASAAPPPPTSAQALAHAQEGSMWYLDDGRVVLRYRLPWSEVVVDFHDRVKTLTSGYASFNYTEDAPRAANLAKVDVSVNGENVDALSFVAFHDQAQSRGRRVCQRLQKVVKRQNFEVVLQAKVGAKVLARERIAPYRKDVLVKSGKNVGGGDVTRKRKLLEKQKKGKARAKSVGRVELSQEAFWSVIAPE
jgi:translation elongation factor EF-4